MTTVRWGRVALVLGVLVTGSMLVGQARAQMVPVVAVTEGRTPDGRVIERVNGKRPGSAMPVMDAVRDYVFRYQVANGNEGLPPGVARQVSRADNLPVGWQARVVRGEIFPRDLRKFAKIFDYGQVPQATNEDADMDFVVLRNRVIQVDRPSGRVIAFMDLK